MGWMAPLRHRRAKLVFRRITRNEREPSMSEITTIDLGWTENRTVAIEYRCAEGRAELSRFITCRSRMMRGIAPLNKRGQERQLRPARHRLLD
jgi:hypothetical protein